MNSPRTTKEQVIDFAGDEPEERVQAEVPSYQMDYERFVAIREGHFNVASDEYFGARPHLDTPENRRIFYAGHCKGYAIQQTEALTNKVTP